MAGFRYAPPNKHIGHLLEEMVLLITEDHQRMHNAQRHTRPELETYTF